MFSFSLHFELIFVRVQLHYSARGFPVVPTPSIEKTILSTLNGLGTPVENQLAIETRMKHGNFGIWYLQKQF